jgi:2-dehydro-3-deoxygluconokinase
MPEVVTFGEVLAMFVPLTAEPLRYARQFELRWGGAECNFAIALSRLGVASGWFSLLGDDELGRLIYNGARGEGVDVSRARLVASAPTGLYLKQFVGGSTHVYYYRRGSAASMLGPDDVDEAYLREARWLHLSGITPALSDSCCAAVERALEIARRHGLTVSFDPNLRLKLWSLEQARAVLVPLMQRCDVLLAGEEELLPLLDVPTREAAVDAVLGWNGPLMAFKLGADGALIAAGNTAVSVPAMSCPAIVDPIGAGDGFDAGVVAGQLKGWDLVESARLGNVVGASALGVRGDFEGYPSLAEAETILRGQRPVAR